MKEPKFSPPLGPKWTTMTDLALNNEGLTLKLKLSEDKEQMYLVDGDGMIMGKCNTVDFVDTYNEEITFKDDK